MMNTEWDGNPPGVCCLLKLQHWQVFESNYTNALPVQELLKCPATKKAHFWLIVQT